MRLGEAEKSSARHIAWSLIVLVLLTAAVRVPLLDIPFERDEGEYAYIGWRSGHGELPYRDWIDQKPPAIFWVYRLALSLPFNPETAVHLIALLFSTATACGLFFLANRFLNWFWSLAASMLFVLLSADPLLYGPSANTELFMLLPLVLSGITFLRSVESGQGRNVLFVLTGVFIGAAAAFKQVAAVNWLFLVAIVPVFVPRNVRLRQMILFAVWSGVGGLLVWGLIGFYFAVHSGWSDFIYNVFTHNFAYVSAVSSSHRWDYCMKTLRSLAHDELLVWIFAAGGFFALASPKRWKAFAFFGGWTIASAIGVSASGYFFPHYFQQLLPALCLAAAFGGKEVETWNKALASVFVSRAAITLLLVALPLNFMFPFLFVYPTNTATDKIYAGNHFVEKRQMAERLKKITSPEDKVFVFGSEAEILFYAQRVSATRYIFLFPLYGPYADARAKQAATAEEIERNRPAAIVYLPNDLFYQPGSDPYFTDWTQSYMRKNFHPDTYLGYNKAGAICIVTDVPHQTQTALVDLGVFGEIDVRNAVDPKVR